MPRTRHRTWRQVCSLRRSARISLRKVSHTRCRTSRPRDCLPRISYNECSPRLPSTQPTHRAAPWRLSGRRVEALGEPVVGVGEHRAELLAHCLERSLELKTVFSNDDPIVSQPDRNPGLDRTRTAWLASPTAGRNNANRIRSGEDKLRVRCLSALLPVPAGLADPCGPREDDPERCRSIQMG